MNETALRSTPVVANCAWCRSAFPAHLSKTIVDYFDIGDQVVFCQTCYSRVIGASDGDTPAAVEPKRKGVIL